VDLVEAEDAAGRDPKWEGGGVGTGDPEL